MSGFKGEYLRIRTPRTVDGINLKYDNSGQIEYKESHVAVTARKSFELENASRPNQLKHIIEHVGGVNSKPVETKTPKTPKQPKDSQQ